MWRPAPVFDYFDDDGDGVLDSTPGKGVGVGTLLVEPGYY